MLKVEYADPLRQFAKSKDTAIIPPYEAKTLFGNIDQLLPVNEAFLAALEAMGPNPETAGCIGDVCLKHFKELRGFENYKQYYIKREEAQAIFEQQLKHSSFAGFIDVCLPDFGPLFSYWRANRTHNSLFSASNTRRKMSEIASVCASYSWSQSSEYHDIP